MTLRPDPTSDFDPMLDSLEDPGEGFVCGCGAELSGADLEAMDAELEGDTCGGSGVLHCYCGGDFCVCHNHGEVECPGCDDCDGDDDLYWNPEEDRWET